ncbi:site-specific integrase [Novosphingobium sp. P6W]|uniref:site-specific integrase n=1 Tax=Novosphingobium sp. P6W TaxID=1609758 RepID=UPI0013B3801D|nr:site-specific integrase [Novosphingobium sp. P6W]
MGHNDALGAAINHENRAESRPQLWVTNVGHKRSIRGLYRRGSIYQFRVRVPVELREVIGSSHVKRSLRTDSLSLAVRLSRKVASEVETAFEEARRERGLVKAVGRIADGLVSQTTAITISARCESDVGRSAGPTLSEVYERYLEDPTKRRSDRTMLAHHTTRRVIEDIFGQEKLVTEITREDCRNLLETLRWLPVNVGKKFGAISIRNAASLAKADARIRTINATNLNAYMARFATMLNWAVAEEYIGRNPARGLQIAEPVHPQDRRKPFELWQLRRVFTAPIYTGCRDDQHGYATPGDVVAKGARYWVPLIALWSGMRLNEICQLDVADVRTIEGVLCFAVTSKSLAGTRDKTLKTKSSERLVPVHPSLLDLGLSAFVSDQRKNGTIKLFDDLPAGARGFRSVAFSRWFSRFLVSANAAAAKTCFHSFRHGFRDAARNARIDRDIALRLGGWIAGGTQSESADDYGSGYRPQILYDAISVIEYPELDLSHLLKRPR